MKKLITIGLLIATTAFAQAWNTWQPFQPTPSNWVAANSGGGGAASFVFAALGAATGDRWHLNVASGNVTSTDLGDTYTADAGFAYQQGAIGDILAMSSVSPAALVLKNTSPNAAVDPLTADFICCLQFSQRSGGSPAVVEYMFDYDHSGTTNQNGFYVGIRADGRFRAQIGDGSNDHTSYTTFTDDFSLSDDEIHTVCAFFDRSEAAITWEIDGVTSAAVNTVGTLSTVSGSIAPAAGIGIFAKDGDANHFYGYIYQAAVVIGDISWRPYATVGEYPTGAVANLFQKGLDRWALNFLPYRQATVGISTWSPATLFRWNTATYMSPTPTARIQ